MTTTHTEARVYVGTYAKYNSGSIAGQWLTLRDYADKDAFLEACAELHTDESDPELMFQDCEGFPKQWYAESDINEKVWEWLALDEQEQTIWALYCDNCGESDFDTARDAFMGCADSEADWAEQFLDDTGAFQGVPDMLRTYFDFEAYARDARLSGDVFFVHSLGEVYVFSNH